jgi:hypothetical protein
MRYEFLADTSAPSSPEWHSAGHLFADNDLLENVPVVVSTQARPNGSTVTVANRGATTVTYESAGRSGIQLFQEIENHGVWTPENWDWCGTGKETFELAAGEQVSVEVDFWDARRERMLGCFSEKNTARCGLVVLASEGPQVTPDFGMMILLASGSFAAFAVWLTVRIINRRERWAICTLAIVVGMPMLYVASFGPARAVIGPKRLLYEQDAILDAYRIFYRPLTCATEESPLVYGLVDRYCSIWERGLGQL